MPRKQKRVARPLSEGELSNLETGPQATQKGAQAASNQMGLGDRPYLEALAIRRRWPSTAQRRKEVLETMFDLVKNCADPRAKVRAAKVIMDAEKIDNERIANIQEAQTVLSPPKGKTTVRFQVSQAEAALFAVTDPNIFAQSVARELQEKREAETGQLVHVPAPVNQTETGTGFDPGSKHR